MKLPKAARMNAKWTDMPRLPSKVALITGAARGIGKAVAQAVVREGASVFATDLDTNPDLDRSAGPRVDST